MCFDNSKHAYLSSQCCDTFAINWRTLSRHRQCNRIQQLATFISGSHITIPWCDTFTRNIHILFAHMYVCIHACIPFQPRHVFHIVYANVQCQCWHASHCIYAYIQSENWLHYHCFSCTSWRMLYICIYIYPYIYRVKIGCTIHIFYVLYDVCFTAHLQIYSVNVYWHASSRMYAYI